MIHKANILTIPLLLITFLGSAIAQQCPFSEWMTCKGTRLYRNASGTAYTYVTDHTAVDVRGDNQGQSIHIETTGEQSTHGGNARYRTQRLTGRWHPRVRSPWVVLT